IEFFSSPSADPSGFGEGKVFLGSTNVFTDGGGNFTFTTSVPAVAFGASISATATDPNSNTSEFSQAITATAALASISVSPSSATIFRGQTQQYTAKGTFADTSTVDITNSVTWSSDNTPVATINASSGLATGVAVGTAHITATSGAITSPSATLKVVAATLQ